MIITKKKIRTVLLEAEGTLRDGVNRVASFADAKDFKRSLLKALDRHPGFANAAHELYADAKTAVNGLRSDVARNIGPSVRKRAPRRGRPLQSRRASKKK